MPTYTQWCDLLDDLVKRATHYGDVIPEDKAWLHSNGCTSQEFDTPYGTICLLTPPWVLQAFEPFRVFIRNWDAIEQSLCLAPSSRVLDLGCGAGPHTVFLAMARHRVTAIDINELATLTCSANLYLNGFGNQSHIGHEIIHSAFPHVKLPCKFDLIVTNPPLQTMDRPLENNMSYALFSYVTNGWRDDNGLDMLDILFERLDDVLLPCGGVLITVINVDRGYHHEILKKASVYGLILKKCWSEIVKYSNLGIKRSTVDHFCLDGNGVFNTRFCDTFPDTENRDLDKTMVFIFHFIRKNMCM